MTGASKSNSPVKERECLGFRASMKEDTLCALLGRLDARLPEDRLADPRLAGKHQSARALPDVVEERSDRTKLIVTTDERSRSHNPARIVTRLYRGV